MKETPWEAEFRKDREAGLYNPYPFEERDYDEGWGDLPPCGLHRVTRPVEDDDVEEAA